MPRRPRRLLAAALATGCLTGLAACGEQRDPGSGEVAILPADESAPYTVPRTEPAVPAAAAGAGAAALGRLQPLDPATAPPLTATPRATTTPGRAASRAARRAGCSLRRLPIEGTGHTLGRVRYRSNPPSSGDHSPTPAPDGIYVAGSTPPTERLVHSLEHGRVEIQYAAGTPKRTVDRLETVASEELRGTEAYHVLVFRNTTRMPYAVAAVSWGRVLGCRRYTAAVPAAIRAFRVAYTDTAPEFIP